jgi:hypothetical protein
MFVLQQLLQPFLVGNPMDIGRNLACLGCHAPHRHVLDGYRPLAEAMGLESLIAPFLNIPLFQHWKTRLAASEIASAYFSMYLAI